jgi:hypothetical protein
MGPVIQGLRKPVNDLSRGCTVDDIVNTICVTGIQVRAVAFVLPAVCSDQLDRVVWVARHCSERLFDTVTCQSRMPHTLP